MAAKTPLIYERGTSGAEHSSRAFEGHVKRILWAAAGVLLLGTAIDLGILWLIQRQSGPQWEFVATVNTLEAITRPAIGLGLLYVALHIGRSTSTAAYRSLAIAALSLGLAAGALGGLLLTDYFILAKMMGSEAAPAFESTVWKGLSLASIAFILFVPIGVLGIRGPRTD